MEVIAKIANVFEVLGNYLIAGAPFVLGLWITIYNLSNTKTFSGIFSNRNNYVTVNAIVDVITISEINQHSRYKASGKISYQFSVDGLSYKGNRLYRTANGLTTNNPTEFRDFQARYKEQEEIIVYYKIGNPYDSFIEYYQPVSISLCVVGVVCMLSGVAISLIK